MWEVDGVGFEQVLWSWTGTAERFRVGWGSTAEEGKSGELDRAGWGQVTGIVYGED